MNVGYQLRLLVLRQSALAPVLLYLALLAAVYATDAGPAVPAASVTAVVLMPVGAWVLRLVTTSESPPFAELSLVGAGGRGRYLRVRWLAAAAVGVALTAATVAWAVIANPHPYGGSTVPIIVGMSLAEWVAGLGVGMLVAPPVRAGMAVVLVIGVSIASLVVPWLPPLGPMLRGLDHTPVPSAGRLLACIGQAAVVGLLAAAARTGYRLRGSG